MSFGPCMCGACDCPSCGPAQGYEVVRRFVRGRWRYVNPETGEEPDEFEPEPEPKFDDPEREYPNDTR